MEKTIFLKKDIEVLVVSSGGVGTTFLMEAIAPYKKINCSNNTDGYKHLPIPPISFNKNLKVIYVFGDPIMASLSLFRRNYQHTQSLWATKFQQNNYVIPESIAIDEYVTNKKDGLYFEKHFNNWKDNYLSYPTMFLKYENIHDSIEVISLFLNMPNSFIQNFPKKRERKSSINTISEESKLGLQKLYGEHQSTIQGYADFFILQPKKRIFNHLFTQVYRSAIVDSFYKKNPLLRKIKNKMWK